MAIKDWPQEQRPREKLLLHGAGILSDAELLAVCLGSGVRGRSAVDLGQALLRRSGGLRPLLAGQAEARLPGLGEAGAARLAAVLELARHCLREDLLRSTSLRDPVESLEFLHAQLATQSVEVFGCVFLDAAHRVIAFEELFHGTVDRTAVYPREVVRACIRHNAAAVILAPNHPSGLAEPSDMDCALTRELAATLDIVGVRVLDHFIIGTGNTVSLAQRGVL